MEEQPDKNTKKQIKQNWKIILVIFAFIITLMIVAVAVYFITSYRGNRRTAECERHIQEHERNLQNCEMVKSWFEDYLSNCEKRAGEYYKVLEEHNLLPPD